MRSVPLVERVEQFIGSLSLYLFTIKWGVDLAKFNSPCCVNKKMRAHGERKRRGIRIGKRMYLKGVLPFQLNSYERVEWFDFDLQCHQSLISIQLPSGAI